MNFDEIFCVPGYYGDIRFTIDGYCSFRDISIYMGKTEAWFYKHVFDDHMTHFKKVYPGQLMTKKVNGELFFHPAPAALVLKRLYPHKSPGDIDILHKELRDRKPIKTHTYMYSLLTDHKQSNMQNQMRIDRVSMLICEKWNIASVTCLPPELAKDWMYFINELEAMSSIFLDKDIVADMCTRPLKDYVK